MPQVVPLDFLAVGEQGRVFEIDGDRPLVIRLAEMGLRQGVWVRMVKAGSPCIIAVGEHRMSFRADDCATVLVEING